MIYNQSKTKSLKEKLNEETELKLQGILEENHKEEESFLEEFIVDEERLKQISDKLVIISQQHKALVAEIHSTSKVMDRLDKRNDICEKEITDEEIEINSFLQWDTSDLLKEAEEDGN